MTSKVVHAAGEPIRLGLTFWQNTSIDPAAIEAHLATGPK